MKWSKLSFCYELKKNEWENRHELVHLRDTANSKVLEQLIHMLLFTSHTMIEKYLLKQDQIKKLWKACLTLLNGLLQYNGDVKGLNFEVIIFFSTHRERLKWQAAFPWSQPNCVRRIDNAPRRVVWRRKSSNYLHQQFAFFFHQCPFLRRPFSISN